MVNPTTHILSVRITIYQSIGILKLLMSYSQKRSIPLTSISTILTDMLVSSQCSDRTSSKVPASGMAMKLLCTLVPNTQLMERGTISNSRFIIPFIKIRKKSLEAGEVVVKLHQEVVDIEEILQEVRQLRQMMLREEVATLKKKYLSELVDTSNLPSQSFSVLMIMMKFPKKRMIYSNCSWMTSSLARQIHMWRKSISVGSWKLLIGVTDGRIKDLLLFPHVTNISIGMFFRRSTQSKSTT